MCQEIMFPVSHCQKQEQSSTVLAIIYFYERSMYQLTKVIKSQFSVILSTTETSPKIGVWILCVFIIKVNCFCN